MAGKAGVVSQISIYPLKGARAIDLTHGAARARGLAHDRRFIATDADGGFLTQRNCPALATLDVTLTADGVRLSREGAGAVNAAAPGNGARRTVTVWKHRVDALSVGGAADRWLSAALGVEARLFFMDAAAERRTSDTWTEPAPVSFADGYPYLIATTASLKALNEAIEASGGASVPMNRFRPNIVIDTDEPWAEDHWRTITIGGAQFELVKPCDRCVVTTLDQKTGAAASKEPLASLARLRRSADPRINGVLFGWNATLRKQGDVSVGDAVSVTDRREEGWPIA
ncbi:MAG: MOSC N-terminal beta barrel domain-containing protein [Pseudomonadota bacterium]